MEFFAFKGILRLMERKFDQTKSEDNSRVANLSAFQSKILSKACSFPSVDTIVYSTCSIHKEENEDVVAKFLHENSAWELRCPYRFARWKRRGLRYAYSLFL